MLGCDVRDHSVNAVMVMPGVLAIFLDPGASLSGKTLLDAITL